MFTGIIETTAKATKQTDEKLIISRPTKFKNLTIGQSIATNGACLSVAQYDDKTMSFDVLSETFRRTNLGTTKTVNLERAMPADGRFEGHIVLGHVDGTIELRERISETSGEKFIFSLPSKKKYLLEKGSISLNGVSLTLGKITDNTFEVFLIPITLEYTNLGNLAVGEKVNFEYDYVAKIIAQDL